MRRARTRGLYTISALCVVHKTVDGSGDNKIKRVKKIKSRTDNILSVEHWDSYS